MKKKLSVYFMLFSFSLLVFFPGLNTNRQAKAETNAAASYEDEDTPMEILWQCIASGVGGLSAGGGIGEEEHKSHEDGGHSIHFLAPDFSCLYQHSEAFENIKTYNLCLNNGYQFMVFAPPERAVMLS